MGQNSVAGIATCCRLDGLWFRPQWKQEILSSAHLTRLALGSIQPPIQWVLRLFPKGKRARAGGDHPALYSTEVNPLARQVNYS